MTLPRPEPSDLAAPVGPGGSPRRDERGPPRLGRRAFLGALGISGAVSLAGCERRPIGYALPLGRGHEDSQPGVFVPYASTCQACPGGCGLLAMVRDGRPVKLEGLPEHPISGGGLCALGQASLRGLYDAGRLRGPRLDGAATSWAAVDARVVERLAAAHGRVALLAPTLVGPTARRTAQAFVDRHGGRLVESDPGLGAGPAVREAYRLLDGVARTPALHVDRADVLLTIGGDLLGTGPEVVGITGDYAARRRRRAGGPAFRHIHIGGNLTLTGAAADRRLRATAAERGLFAAALLGRLAAKAEGPAAVLARTLTGPLPPPPGLGHEIASIAEQLWRARGRALVTSGARDPAEQLAVALLGRLLEAERTTLALDEEVATTRGSDRALDRLLVDLEAGRVQALVLWDVNPVEQLPDGGRLGEIIGRLPLGVALTSRPTGTARACQVVAATHHELERWGDAAPRAGVLTLAQPAIRPLFDTRDPCECLLGWSGRANPDYRAELEASWRSALGAEGASWPERWSALCARALADPHEAARAFGAAGGPPADDDLAAASDARPAGGDADLLGLLMSSLPPPSPEALEVELGEQVGLGDGRASFNPWLRELPDPLTRSAWVPVARLAPALARAHGVAEGDLVSVRVGERAVQLPACIVPGQHPRVIGIPVGYGLLDGDGGAEERNGYRLARREHDRLVTAGLAASLTLLGGRAELPLVQWSLGREGRPIVAALGSVGAAATGIPRPPAALAAAGARGSPRWHMVIDLDACTGCGACVVACQAENNVPVVGPANVAAHRDMHWLRIDRYFEGSLEDPEVLLQPMLCAHCERAPCETVCPVAATVHSHDGLSMQAYPRCIGSRYCANNCPYKVRRFNWFDFTPTDPLGRLVLNPDVTVRDRGVMEKCSFCVQRIVRARVAGKKRGERGVPEVQTACQQSCPARAIDFGDAVGDPRIVALRRDPRAFQVLAELGIGPSVTYLARIRRPPAGAPDEEGS